MTRLVKVVGQDIAVSLLIAGNEKYAKKNYRGAIADYDQALRLNPDYATAYYNRGNAKSALGDKERSVADYTKAAKLYKQQGNTEWYNNSLAVLKRLGGKSVIGPT